MIQEMESYFERLLASWKRREGTLPQCAITHDEQPLIYESKPDENGMVLWKPKRKTTHTDFKPVEDAIEKPLPSSIKDYFNSYWFASLDGKYQGLGISLMPVLPGIELRSFLTKLVGYKEAHGDRLDHIPLGVEFNGDLVVVDSKTEEVQLEDSERGAFRTIAPSLEKLIQEMAVPG